MLLAILFAWFGYKKASANGRNGILWAAIAAGTFIGTQLVVSLLMGFLLGIILVANGDIDANIGSGYDGYSILATIIALVASIIAGMLVLRYADKPLEEDKYLPPPPPPNNFN